MVITLIIFYIIFSESIFVILWLIDGRKKKILPLIFSAPIIFPIFIVTYIRDLFNPVKGIFQANSSCFFAYKAKWDEENPEKEFPIMEGLLFTLKMRYPHWSNRDAMQFVIENKVNNLISLVEAIINNERPDLNTSWIKYKSNLKKS